MDGSDSLSDEAELVRLAQGGDEWAFSVLHQRYRSALVRYAERCGLQRSDAEDVVQRTLLDAYLKLPQLENPGAFSGWLYTITARNLYDLRRKQLAGPQSELPPLPDDSCCDPAEIVSAVEQRRKLLQHAASVLSQEQLQMLLLRYEQGLKPREIAKLLGKGAISVRVALFRARLQLVSFWGES